MKLSIITVNLNNADGLRKTIESVVTQTYIHFEHIIIDGGSTEGSVEVIKEYEDKYMHIQGGLYWISEPDKGIYNGMNKGIKVAKGEYCLFLNSGDWLLNSNTLEQVFKFKAKEDIIYCDLKRENNQCTYPDELSFYIFFIASIGHPASFIKRQLFIDQGLYNEKYKIVSDWEFFLKALFVNHYSYRHIPLFTTYFASGGFSTQKDMIILHKQERNKVLSEHFYWLVKDYNLINQLNQELSFYKNSRLVQFAKKIQETSFYKKLRKTNKYL